MRTDLDSDRDLHTARAIGVEYLEAAVGAWFAGTEPPLLLPGV